MATLLNTTDAPCKVNTRTAKTKEELHKQLADREDALLTLLKNLAKIAETALGGGHDAAVVEALDLARTARAELAEIQGMRA